LFPGTGFPTDCGDGAAGGTSVNIAVPAGTGDASCLRAFHVVGAVFSILGATGRAIGGRKYWY